MPDVCFRVLGPVEAAVDETTLDLGGPRQRTVLAVLLTLRNQVVSSDRLVDETWGDEAPARARHSLQTYVSNLRRLLGSGRIETRHPGYVLHVDAGEFDGDEFEALVEHGRPLVTTDPAAAQRDLSRALDLWRGELPYAGLADEVPVLRQDAERLRELRFVAVEQLAEARLALGEHETLVPELRELTELQPYREGLWSLLMRALYRSGRQAEALGAYQTLRARLVEELGIDPSPDLQELELRLLTQTEQGVVTDHAPRHPLPSPPSRFVGRQVELAWLVSAVRDQRLVTVTGPAGVGKTRLAIEAAHELVDDFASGAYFVDLTAVADPEDVPAAVASGLRMNDQSGRSPETAVSEYLADRHLLLVLDNCEHVSERVAGLVWRLVSTSDRLHVLASSQDRLDLDGEHIVVLSPMAVGEGGHMDGAETEAESLFIARAKEHTPNLALSDGDRSAVRDICKRLDGLPLAIELAASRARSLSPPEILKRLDDRFALLGSSRRSGPERHQTLRAAVEWSYSLLGDQERAVFDRLSVLTGEFSFDSAEAVAGEDAGAAFLDTLEALVNRSLVARVPAEGEARYRMLESLRLFGRERLRIAGDLESLEQRKATVFAAIAVRQADRVRSPEYLDALARIEADLDNIRQSFRWAVDHGEFDLAFDLTRPLWRLVFAGARRHLREGADWRDLLLTRAPDESMRARLLAEQGFSLWLVGEQAAAAERAEESLELTASTGPGETLALEVLALNAATNQETARAVELAERILDLGGDGVDAIALETLAMAYIFSGQAQAAVDTVERVFAEAERRGDPLRRIRALALMGSALQQLDLPASQEMLDEAVETTRDLGMDWDLAGAVMARSLTELMSGDTARAVGDLEWACRLTYRVRDLRRLTQTLEILGGLLSRNDRAIEAARLLSAAVALREATGVAGSIAQEQSRREALEQLEASLDSEAFAQAGRWGKGTTTAEVAQYGALAAAALREHLLAQ